MADQRAIVDVVCKTGVTNLATEIGALLGQELTCTDVKLDVISKETLFSDLTREKTALTRMDIGGDQEGDCFLLTRLDTAITLAGTLIMLPDDVIQETIASGELDGEMADAYGEVANIIAGVFTQAFVDKYPKTIRFIKKTVEELVPTKIDMASEQPFPPANYYVASGILNIGENSLGAIEFVVPAAVFGLNEEAASEEVTESEPAVEAEAVSASSPEPTQEATEQPAELGAEPTRKMPPFADAKKLTDVIFKAILNQVGEEIGTLLGKDLVCDDIKLEMVNKSDFFSDHCMEKSAMSLMKISGDREGYGFLFTQVPDAIILGGTLIMLPDDQIAEKAEKFDFDGESVDAYGEIANILAGSLTQVFLDRYPHQLRFVRTETEVLVPTKLEPNSDEPFPAGDYYLANCSIGMEGYELNRLSLLFPAEVFDLDPNQTDATTAASAADLPEGQTAPAESAPAASPTGEPATAVSAPAAPVALAPGESPVVLIISEQQNDAELFVEILSSSNCDCKVITFQDDIKALAEQHRPHGIFLIMSQVGEKGFATAIKLQSVSKPAPPLIFAGPDWTRSTVMRAVKYGARDILMLPASNDEIQEKVSHHILKAS